MFKKGKFMQAWVCYGKHQERTIWKMTDSMNLGPRQKRQESLNNYDTES